MNDFAKKSRNAAEEALSHALVSTAAGSQTQDKARIFQSEAARLFADKGLPTRRVESWHYTDLRAAMKEALPLAEPPDAARVAKVAAHLPPAAEGQTRAVLIDGYYVDSLSAFAGTAGIAMRPVDDILAGGDDGSLNILAARDQGAGDPALALNAALMRGGVEIDVEPGHKPAHPLEIYSFTSGDRPKAIYSRSVVRAGKQSEFTLVERHIDLGDAPVQKNDCLVLMGSNRSQIEHVFVRQAARENVLHVHSLLPAVWEFVKINSTALIEGGGLLRRQVFARFMWEGGELSLSGVSLLRNRDHADTTLVVDHAQASNVSREYFKHIVDGSATGVFQGKVIVAPNAQKTDGAMKSQTILLGEDAAMYNKPELEIFADDVTCSHGATVAALDPQQLFYAMSRGIAREEAEALLLEAFAGDALERVTSEALREELLARVRAWLAGRAR